MKKSIVPGVLVALSFLVVAGCATLEIGKHKYLMKGQIVEISGSEAYLCIGSAEGVQVGQEFTVRRYEKESLAGSRQDAFSYKRVSIGAVRIRQIVNEHFARAAILRGDIRVNDVAELAP